MEARDYIADLRRWGLTQARIAELTGIPQPTISKIVRGEVDDVLSRKYRRLQAVHDLQRAKRESEGPSTSAVAFATMPPSVQRAIVGEG
jgi:predicted transcriptional regulator